MKWLAVVLWGLIIGGLLGLEPPQPPAVVQVVQQPTTPPLSQKFMVTPTMEVSAGFYTTDCSAWGFQINCQHWGTDLLGLEGTPVYAPYQMTIIALGSYGPGPTWGDYIQGTLPDGAVLYLGHLKDRQAMEVGTVLPAGTLLGFTNAYNHTHLQLAGPGNTGPCAQDGSCFDFMTYFQEH